jgi:glycine/D-amino acid oxidase-like deaminating enzyme
VATPDRLMLAGAFPGVRGLHLAVGGNGHGFMRAPALGESLAALVLGEKPRIDLDAYDPARFADDDPSRGFEIREGYSIEGSAFK